MWNDSAQRDASISERYMLYMGVLVGGTFGSCIGIILGVIITMH